MAPRSTPYIYATWLPPLLAGANFCEWAVWFQSHNKLDRRAKTFDNVTWIADHGSQLQIMRARLEAEGYIVYQEDQNWFKLEGRTGTELNGKPDLIAISDDGSEGIICDVKTGAPHDYHQLQVALYMWAVPKAFPDWRHIRFSGRLSYKDEDVLVPTGAVSPHFEHRAIALIKRIADDRPAPKVPSARECAFCVITAQDCSDRVEGPLQTSVRVDDF